MDIKIYDLVTGNEERILKGMRDDEFSWESFFIAGINIDGIKF